MAKRIFGRKKLFIFIASLSIGYFTVAGAQENATATVAYESAPLPRGDAICSRLPQEPGLATRELDYIKFKKQNNDFGNIEADLTLSDENLVEQVRGIMSKRFPRKPDDGRCDLSAIELLAILDYTAAGFIKLNMQLRAGGDKGTEVKAFETILNGALKKIRPYQGYVRRGIIEGENYLRDSVGKIVTFPAFTSSSTGSGFHGNIRMIIKSKTGRPINAFTIIDEKEVLFPSNSSFRVLDWADKDLYAEVIMEEVVPETATQPKESRDPSSVSESRHLKSIISEAKKEFAKAKKLKTPSADFQKRMNSGI